MRGKHAVASERRRAAETAISELETYQRRVAQLTADLKEEKARRKTDAEAFRAEIRTAQNMAASGTTPELMAAEARIRVLIEELHRAQSQMRREANDARVLVGQMQTVVEAVCGLTNEELRAMIWGAGAKFGIAKQKQRDYETIEALYRVRKQLASPRIAMATLEEGSGRSNRLPYDIVPKDDPMYVVIDALRNEREELVQQVKELHKAFLEGLDRWEPR